MVLRILRVAAVCALPLLPGCIGAWMVGGAAAVSGVSAVSYLRGTLKADLNAPIFEADLAVRRVASRIPLMTTERTSDGYSVLVFTKDVRDTPVSFHLVSLGPQRTRISIHVGNFGDKGSSTELLGLVEDELQTIMSGR